MRPFTTIDHFMRQQFGLPALATREDLEKSVESIGVPTDYFKVAATKLFNVDYCFVTPAQREAAKRACYSNQYS